MASVPTRSVPLSEARSGLFSQYRRRGVDALNGTLHLLPAGIKLKLQYLFGLLLAGRPETLVFFYSLGTIGLSPSLA
jgi:hypothetical protein